jgi:hypothetical protein
MSDFGLIPYYLEFSEEKSESENRTSVRFSQEVYLHYRNYDKVDQLIIPHGYKDIFFQERGVKRKWNLFALKNQRILAYSSKDICFYIFKIENAVLKSERKLPNAVNFLKFEDVNDVESHFLYLSKQNQGRERTVYLYEVVKKGFNEYIELMRFYDQAEAGFLGASDSRYFYVIADGDTYIYDTKRKEKKPIYTRRNKLGYVENMKIPRPIKIGDNVIIYDVNEHNLLVYNVKMETTTKIINSNYASDYYVDQEGLHGVIQRAGSDKLIIKSWDITTFEEKETIEIPLNTKMPDNVRIGWGKGFNINREEKDLADGDKGNFVIPITEEEIKEIRENVKKILSKHIKVAKPLIGIIAKFIV